MVNGKNLPTGRWAITYLAKPTLRSDHFVVLFQGEVVFLEALPAPPVGIGGRQLGLMLPLSNARSVVLVAPFPSRPALATRRRPAAL